MRRRTFMLAAGAAGVSPLSGRGASAAPAPSKKTYVLVHGAYHGGWCWKEVAARLRAEGHDVYTPTQTGLGDRAHLISFRPTLATFIEDVASLLAMEDLTDVILVGHSFAGSTVSGVADRMPERLRHLVYLDALILQPGTAPFDGLPADIVARYASLAQESSGGLSVPPPKPSYFGVVDPAQAAWVSTKLTPHPFGTYTSELKLKGPVGNGLPATYIATTAPPFASTATSRDFAKTMARWSYVEIATGHDTMLLMPAETARLLSEIG